MPSGLFQDSPACGHSAHPMQDCRAACPPVPYLAPLTDGASCVLPTRAWGSRRHKRLPEKNSFTPRARAKQPARTRTAGGPARLPSLAAVRGGAQRGGWRAQAGQTPESWRPLRAPPSAPLLVQGGPRHVTPPLHHVLFSVQVSYSLWSLFMSPLCAWLFQQCWDVHVLRLFFTTSRSCYYALWDLPGDVLTAPASALCG